MNPQPSPGPILEFLRRCYQDSGSPWSLWNIFAPSVPRRLFLGPVDTLLSEAADRLPVFLRETEARDLAVASELDRMEKDLLAGCLFFVGQCEIMEGRPEAVCAPLFLHPASLETTGLVQGASLTIDHGKRIWNYPLLEALGGGSFTETIQDVAGEDALSPGAIAGIREAFRSVVPELDIASLDQFPTLTGERELKKRWTQIKDGKKTTPALFAAESLLLVKKSTQMRGVLNALESMAKSESVSTPLAILLGLGGEEKCRAPDGPDWIPSLLSVSQKAALTAARCRPVSVVNGPPGTGKSHTIAAIAIDAISRGESVLIGSRSDQAVDVVHRKITDTLGIKGLAVRGGGGSYLQGLKEVVASLLEGITKADDQGPGSLKRAKSELKRLDRLIASLVRQEEKRWQEERNLAASLEKQPTGWWSRWRRHRALARVKSNSPVWLLSDEKWQATGQRQSIATQLVISSHRARLQQLLEKNRDLFVKFDRALRTRSGTKKHSLFEDLDRNLFRLAFPVWLVNLADLDKVLPLEQGLFDLAIIDEATQCDMASALPLFHRAKRIIIAGDPRQLRHVSFLSHARQSAHADACGLDEATRLRLDFRNRSLLDLALESLTKQDDISFLDEHFRSRPGIIAFSNRHFYQNQLRVMTTAHNDAANQTIHLHHVTGQRSEKGDNVAEANAIVDALERIRKTGKIAGEKPPSIGILSPFRSQVDLLQNSIQDAVARNKIPASFVEETSLLVGTAHSFQGEERDIMLLSLVIDEGSPAASLRFLERPDVFNVSITRARRENHLFLSLNPSKLPLDSLLRSYVTDAPPENLSQPRGTRAHLPIALEIKKELEAAGFTVALSHEVAGMVIDILFHRRGQPVGIDLIAPTDTPLDASTLTPSRHIILRRAGLEMIPLPVTHWREKRAETMQRLLSGPQPPLSPGH
jgi:hypothetical protein